MRGRSAPAAGEAPSGRPLESGGKPLACFGELGLTGEIRYVAHADRRVAEARKFGLAEVLGPPPGDESVKGLQSAATLRDALTSSNARGLRQAA